MKQATHIKPPNERMTATARRLRRAAPVPERLLWGRLRAGRLGGWKFRRQHPMEPFVVDFYCHDARLVIELDGDSHHGRAEEDRAREAFLRTHGLRVVRFANDDVLRHLDGVVETIWKVLGGRRAIGDVGLSEAPSPGPSQGEGGKT